MAKELFHLPDLPNAGYATRRQKELSDMVQEFIRQIERERLRMLTIVIEGKRKWRKHAGDIWRGHRIGEDAELLDAIYDYLTLMSVRPRTAALLMAAQQNPPKWREIVRIVMPHLEKEREGLKLAQKWSPFR